MSEVQQKELKRLPLNKTGRVMVNETFSKYTKSLLTCKDPTGLNIGKEVSKLYNKWKADPIKNVDVYIELSEKIMKEQELINKALGMKDIAKRMRGELFEELVSDILNREIPSLQQVGLKLFRKKRLIVWQGYVPAKNANFEKQSYQAEFDLVIGKPLKEKGNIAPIIAISCKTNPGAGDLQMDALRFSLLKTIYPKVVCLFVATPSRTGEKVSIKESLKYALWNFLDDIFVLDNKGEINRFIEKVKESLSKFVFA
ncbi:MAG: hypothetical protein QXU45_06150 [Candidatus Bathyarchaeia archaeon]